MEALVVIAVIVALIAGHHAGATPTRTTGTAAPAATVA